MHAGEAAAVGATGAGADAVSAGSATSAGVCPVTTPVGWLDGLLAVPEPFGVVGRADGGVLVASAGARSPVAGAVGAAWSDASGGAGTVTAGTEDGGTVSTFCCHGATVITVMVVAANAPVPRAVLTR